MEWKAAAEAKYSLPTLFLATQVLIKSDEVSSGVSIEGHLGGQGEGCAR